MRHSTHDLASGARLHRWQQEGQQEPRALVQLQHGYGEYAERYVTEFGQLVPQLVRRGIDVWAIDLLGHGRSPGRRGLTDARHAVDDHVTVRSRMLERDLPIVVVGHSFGGLLTAGSIVASPMGVAGAVILAPSIVTETSPAVLRLAMLAGRLFPAAPLPAKPAPPSDLSRRADVVARAAADPLQHHGRVPLLLAATALDVSAHVWRGAPSWSTPTLFMHGTADTSTSSERTRDLARRIGPELATYVAVEGGRHELLHDDGGHQHVARVLHWIGDRVGA